MKAPQNTRQTRIKPSFIAYLSRSLALATLAAMGLGRSEAANFNWDPTIDTGLTGGVGTWDLSTANWYNGAADVVWPNNVSLTDVAVFGGTATGLVTINTGATGVTANGLTFNTTGYTLAGNTAGELLTLSGTTPTITVTNSADSATISAVIAGTTGLNKAGSGTLFASGVNTFAGGVSITGGTLSVGADSGLGAAANGLTIDGGSLQATGTFTSVRTVTLGASGGTLDVTAANNLTLSTALVANANALTKIGAGTVTLSAASTRTGATAVNGGILAVSNIGAVGTGDITAGTGGTFQNIGAAATLANNVTLNGGTLSQNAAGQLSIGAGKVITIGATGGTLDVGPNALAASKILFAGGQLAGSGVMTKTGVGVVQLSGPNTGFTGSVVINGGTVEFQNVDSLGTAATSITVNNGGDIATGGVANRNTINLLAGGTISANNAAANYTGTVNVAGTATAALRAFQAVATANSFRIDGTLAGPGTLNVTAPAAATLTLGTTPFAAGAATNNSGFTGNINAATNATVVINQGLGATAGYQFSGGTIRLNQQANLTGPTAGVAGINASYFNMGLDVVASGNPSQFASFQLIEPTRVFNRIDQQINIPNGGNGTYPVVPVPGYQFNINDAGMWKGLLNVTTAGNYQFSAINDDQAVLFIDGVQIGTIGVNGAGANVGAVLTNLSAGAHSIVWKFSQGGGGGYTQLRYNGPDTSAATVVVGSVAGSLTTGKLAASDIGALQALSGTSTFDTGVDVNASGFSAVGGSTLNLTSGTIGDIVVTGASTLSGGGTVTLNANSASITFNDAIGDGGSATALTLNGLYKTTFKGANTYTGLTTVSGGRLTLDTTGANSIVGNLTLNALNALGPVRNIVLNQSNQIADTATVTVQSGILDVGANSDTVGTLTVSGGAILGSGTITPTTAINLTGGIIEAGIGGSLGLTKGGNGTVTLSGNSSYTGQTIVNAGALRIGSNNGLGATGAGNETIVNAGGQLQIQGGAVISEDISITGTSALKNFAGLNSITSALTLAGAASIESGGGNLNLVGGVNTAGSALTVQGSGEITITGAITGGGGITKVGNGVLTFNQNMSSLAGVTHTAGILGFNGAQSFGASTVGAGKAYKFNSDPGAGVNVTAAAGSAVIAGYAADQTLLSRLNTASAGALALGVNSSNNLDFSAYATVGLGASGLATYSGTITPNAAGYRFSAGPTSGLTPNVLRLTNALTGATALTVNGGTLDITGLNNTQTGAITVAGGTLRMQSNTELGAVANTVNLDGGTLEYAANSPANANLWFQLGNVLGGGQRTVNIGAAGGTISVSSFGYGNTLLGLSGVNPLTGSGTLTKTGFGHLFLNDASTFSGSIVVAAQSANFEMRSKGSIPNVTSVEVNQSSNFVVDNFNGWGARQFSNPTNDQNRVNDAATITLKGAQLLYRSRNVAGQISETFGTVANPEGQNIVRIEKNGTVGGEILITNFNRPVGGGTVRFEKNAGTFGATGDNARIFLTNVNGAAPGTVNQLGGWAYNTTDFQFVGYGANGIVNSTNTDQAAAAFTPAVSTNVLNLSAGGTATLQDAAGNAHNIAALRFGNNAGQTLAFTDGTNDVLYVASGGILSSNDNQTRTIGSAALRGKLTAGTSTAAAGAKELFFHVNQNTMTVESIVVDNNGAVTLVKDLGGTLQLNAASTYTGGTNLFSGRINVNVAGGLGSGPVTVKGSGLQLNQPGATTAATGVITARDGSEVYLQNVAGVYNTVGDRFVIEGGSALAGNTNNAGQNYASLTRIDVGAAFTAGGQIKLHPNAVIRSVNTVDGDIMTNMIGNLGTNADLYFNQSGGGGASQFINVGQGTPWKGLSSSVGTSGWNQGVINATSDFYLQGLTRVGANVTLQLGNTTAASYAINNISGKPINAFVEGQVLMNEDSPVSISSDITFVVGAGGYLQPAFTNSFGSQAGNLNAKLLVLGGGTVDPGNFVAVGLAANQPVGFAYPVPSPVNTNATFEAGGRFLINDASGIGSTTGGATFTMKANSILELGTQQVFLGSAAGGLVNTGQFVYEPGTIVRVSADRVFKQDVFVNGEPNGKQTVLEIYGGNRNLTDAVDPRVVVAPGNTTVVSMNLAFGNGGIITNDSADRTINERRGSLVLENGAVLAATSQTVFNIQENVALPAAATVTVGSTKYVDGNPKSGLVQFTGPNSNIFGAGAKLVVQDGSAVGLAATNTFPDTAPIELPAAVTNLAPVGAVGFNPGNGSTLLPNVGNFAEIVGHVTGDGSVIANAGGTYLGINATSNFSSNIRFRNANANQANLWKVGSSDLTLTGSSDSLGIVAVANGKLILSGTGNTAFAENRVQEGGTLTLDNTGTALSNRLGGSVLVSNALNKSITPMGGTLHLIGNATTAVEERFANLFNSAGGFGPFQGVTGYTTLKITPGAANTNILVNAAENFQSAGIGLQRAGTWVINTPTAANAPITYLPAGGVSGGIAPGVGATANGLVQIASPNFNSIATFGVQAGGSYGSAGTSVAATRPDYLGDANNDGVPEGFMTQDGVFLPVTNTSGAAVLTGMATTAGLLPGMLVQGSVPNGTRILSVDSASQVTLTANTTAAATNMQFISGGMRNLAASEYASYVRDNQNVGLNVKLTGTSSTSGDTRIQTLTMTPGSTLNITGALPNTESLGRLHLNGGGVFVQGGGTATINGGAASGNSRNFLQAQGGASLFLHTQGDLNLNAMVFTDNAVVKTGPGTLNVGSEAFTGLRGTIQIDEGTVNLAANNRFSSIRAGNGSSSNNHLYINGGTLNLGGNSQMVNTLNNNNELPGMGGTVTSASAATLTITGGGRFSGTVSGAISIDKNANNTLLLTSANPYTGTTLVRAGTLALRDSGTLGGTSSIELQNSTLQLDNSYLSNVSNRIAPTVPVTLRGGTINLTGAAGQVASQTINLLTIGHGQNSITSNAGGGGANELNFGNLVRTANSGSVITFNQSYGFLGTAGNTTTAIRDFITNVNGSPIALTNNILPTWIIANGDHFATYNATTGLSFLGNTEDGYATYESGDVSLATATQNVNDGTARTITASKTINAWRMGGANIVATYNDGVALTIASGGLLANAGGTMSHNAAANARNNSITSGTSELMYWVNQNNNGINIPVVGNIDLVKAGGGGLNLNPSTLLTATAISGNTITLANTAGLEVGDPISGGTTTVYPAGTVITAINPGVSITTNNPVTTVGATLDVRNTFGNTYTGKTYVNGGTLTLNQAAASPTALAVPGDLVINAATVTEANVVGQLKNTANITLVGGGRMNFLDAAGVTETIGSVTFLDGASGTAGSNIDRVGSRVTSIINLSAPTAITATNTNPSTGMPTIGGFAGTVGFTNAGGSTLNITSPTAVNGILATGLTINARIGSVPTGVAEGGLIKAGNGLLALRPDQNQTFGAAATTAVGSNVITGLVGAITGAVPLRVGQMITSSVANAIPANSYIVSIDSDTQIKISQNAGVASATNTITGLLVNEFGNPTTLTDVFNIQSGTVRADTSGALGSNFANTTVQSGAVLLGANNGSQVITGSITLKSGSTLGATISSFIHGAATLTPANQSVLNVPSGNVHIAAYDYYVPSTNNGNINIHGKLTGAGTIDIYGPQITQGNGGGGAITLGNPILTGTGSNDYSGTINVGINSILSNQVALIAGSGITRTTGNAMATATINLDGGRLRLRDDASPTADVNNTTITYGNNVTLSRNSWLDANRQTSASAVNNVINLGTLTVSAGTKVLNVDSGNGYQVGFASLDGPGTLIKAGGSRLNINAIAPTFSGNIGIAGPVGITVAPTFNTTTAQNLVLPTTATLNNFSVNGLYITEAAKTLNVNGVFSVNANPGTGANNMANVAGRVGVTNTTTLNATAIVNDGVVGPLGGAVTLTAPSGFSGSGTYLTTSATAGVATGNPLTLAGNVTGGILRAAGTSTVTITGVTHTPAGAEVQSGTLKLAPSAGVTSTGTIKVFGSASSVASATTAPISAVTGTLEFAPVTTATHTGDVTNSGLVKVSSGTTTITGVVTGSATTQYVPGLLEGLVLGTTGFTVDNTRPANPGNFGVQMEPRMLQNNSVTQQALTGHLDNDVWVYTGYVKDDDGVFSFAGNQDDNLGVWIDGSLVLNSGGNVVGSTAHKMTQNGVGVTTPNGNGGTPSQNFGAGIAIPGYGTGWHLVEIRMRNGTGGAGPWGNNGFTTNYGFGYKNGIGALDGADYIKPIEDGSGSLFLTPLGSKGDISLADATVLNVGGFVQRNVIINSNGNTSELNVTSAGASSADSIQVVDPVVDGNNAAAVMSMAANSAVTTGDLTIANGGSFQMAGDSGSSLTVTATQTLNGSVDVNSGRLNLRGIGSGSGAVTVNDGVLELTGSISGSLTVNGGILTGNSVSGTTGVVSSSTTLIGGAIKLGSDTTNASGQLLFNGGIAFAGASAAFDLNGLTAGTDYDQINVSGTVDLNANVPFTIGLGFAPAPMTTFTLVANDSTDPIGGGFLFSYAGTPLNEGDHFAVGAADFTISYVGGDGNDVTTTFVVPEPGSAALLLGGLAMLAGRRRRKQA